MKFAPEYVTNVLNDNLLDYLSAREQVELAAVAAYEAVVDEAVNG